MKIKKFLKSLAYWFLPLGIQQVFRRLSEGNDFNLHRKALVKRNEVYRNCCSSQSRCFLLGNGTSIMDQDIRPLKDEIVFSMSKGYRHRNFDIIHPHYHCVPQFTYTSRFTPEMAVEWLREMKGHLDSDTEVFFSYTEEPLIRENALFVGRKVNYVNFGKSWDGFSKKPHRIPDISKVIPRIQAAPIMCLMIAMYMGFKEIYLIGTDHDAIRTGRYEYPFKDDSRNLDYKHHVDGKLVYSLREYLPKYTEMFQQFHIMHTIAQSNGVSIFNATKGGALDEYERVDYESLFK